MQHARSASTPRTVARLLIAALAGGFGAVFGVPIAGAVFGLEVQAVGRIRYEALVPCITASVVGDMVVRGLGDQAHDRSRTIGAVSLDAALLGKVALAGLLFGLASVLFSELTHGLKRAFKPRRALDAGPALRRRDP